MDATGTRALECRNRAGKRGSDFIPLLSSAGRVSGFLFILFFFRFLVYSVLAGGVPVKVKLVEELSSFRREVSDRRSSSERRPPLTSPVWPQDP